MGLSVLGLTSTVMPVFANTGVKPANERGHYLIEPLGVELGIRQGEYQNQEWPWMRWWDAQGNLLLTAEERLEQERQRADREQERAERLAAQLRALGVEPEV